MDQFSPASLGKEGVTATSPGQRVFRRSRRHDLKAVQRELTKAKSGRLCYFAGGTVTVTVGRLLIARVTGVHRCASIWSCPLCAPVMREARAKDIELATARVIEAGGSALFLTGTGPHRKGDPLGPLFDLAAKFGHLCLRGRKWAEFQERFGYLGIIRAIEVTYGRPPFDNGWHPHVHALVFFDRLLTDAEVLELRTWLFSRWQGVLTTKGFGALHPVSGLDVRRVTEPAALSEYLAAVDGGWSVGLELARGDLKYKGKTPLDLLALFADTGDLVARALWLEYERVTFGRRAIQWSPGLRVKLLPDVVELTDEEAASAEGEDEVLVSIPFFGDEWNGWVRANRVKEVLREVEEIAALLLYMSGHVVAVNERTLVDA